MTNHESYNYTTKNRRQYQKKSKMLKEKINDIEQLHQITEKIDITLG